MFAMGQLSHSVRPSCTCHRLPRTGIDLTIQRRKGLLVEYARSYSCVYRLQFDVAKVRTHGSCRSVYIDMHKRVLFSIQSAACLLYTSDAADE